MDFLNLGLSKEIVDVLTNLGYTVPTEIQTKAIPLLIANKDVVGRSETGSGKTFAFGLPIIQNVNRDDETIQALVVCPTRELAMQDADEIKKVALPLGVRVCAVFGGSNLDRQIDALKRKPQIVVGTPGRIIDLLKRKALKIASTSKIVLDEADEMLDMGFRPDIEKILQNVAKQRQTILFSATIPDEIKEIIKTYQNDSVMVEVGTENKALDKIEQRYMFVDQKNKKEALKELFYSDIFDKTIVFVNTKRYAEDLERFLNKNKVPAKALHGDLRQSARTRVMKMFKDGKIDILLATDVAARGLDIKEVMYVVNFDLPNQLEFYVHRIGRTARAGKSGKVVDIITNLSQLSNLREIEKLTNAKILPYETNSENLKQYFVDTKKLAQQNNRFAKHGKNRNFGNSAFDDFENERPNKKSKHSKGKKTSGKPYNKTKNSKGFDDKKQRPEIRQNRNGKNRDEKSFDGSKNKLTRSNKAKQSFRKNGRDEFRDEGEDLLIFKTNKHSNKMLNTKEKSRNQQKQNYKNSQQRGKQSKNANKKWFSKFVK